MKMPLLLWNLFLCFLVVYLVQGPVRDILLASDKMAEFMRFFNLRHLRLILTSGLVFFAYTLSAYLALYHFNNRLSNWKLIGIIAVSVFGCIFFRAFIEEGVIKWVTGEGNYNPNTSWKFYILDNLYYALIFTSVGLVFYFSQLARFKTNLANQSELLRREAELKFLRTQVNPHFLFNTINNVYAQVASGSDQALTSLERLSGLLRYSLYEQSQKVPLVREINYLNDFIDLENMRLQDDRRAILKLGTFTRNWEIAPMLLVPFVENAFKHGSKQNEAIPISVQLWESDAFTLDFKVANSNSNSSTLLADVGGIGINNVRQRLQLLYPDQHTLTIENNGDTFTIHLQLKYT